MSASGSPQEKADLRLLRARLRVVPGPVPDKILRETRASVPGNDHFEPVLYLDRKTGQDRVEYGYEVGFSQWEELIPVNPPE